MSRVKEQKEALKRATEILEELEYQYTIFGILQPKEQFISTAPISELIDFSRKIAKFEEDEVWATRLHGSKIAAVIKSSKNINGTPTYSMFIMKEENIDFLGFSRALNSPSTQRIDFPALGDFDPSLVVINLL